MMPAGRPEKVALLAYVLFLHILLGVVLIKSNFIELVQHRLGVDQPEPGPYYRATLAFQLRVDSQLEPGSILFFGDSLVAGLAMSNISPRAVNFGIGGETITELADRLPLYKSVKTAAAVVISAGHNDLRLDEAVDPTAGMSRIVQWMPSRAPILITGVLPVDEGFTDGAPNNLAISQFNARLARFADDHDHVVFLDSYSALASQEGALSNQHHIGDGVHLNAEGNRLWSHQLRQPLQSLIRP